jgi:hypothetical protein
VGGLQGTVLKKCFYFFNNMGFFSFLLNVLCRKIFFNPLKKLNIKSDLFYELIN